MKVVLLQDFPGLGKKGDIKEVHDGYGRNFLLPRGFAKVATTPILNQMSADKKSQEKHEELEKEKTAAIKTRLEKLNLIFKVKMGGKDQPFGSITPTKILNELERKGIRLEKELLPKESIKTLGTHVLKVKLPYNIKADLKIQIEPESSSAASKVSESKKTATAKKSPKNKK